MNLSYCRFQNTASDLAACAENLMPAHPDDVLSGDEKAARRRLIQLCADILGEIGVNVDAGEVSAGIKELEAMNGMGD